MTEQPDTTVWRDLLDRGYGIDLSEGQGYALLDALDAARVERDDWRRSTQKLRNEMEQWDFDEEVSNLRVELGAVRILCASFKHRLEAAEARTKAALELHHDPYASECGDRDCCSEPITECDGCGQEWPCDTYLALTEGPKGE